jgi:hypothetical protein
MIEFVLMVQVCTNYDGDCMWQRVGRFQSEEICVANGLAVDPAVVRFRCAQVQGLAVPLPRPRPR